MKKFALMAVVAFTTVALPAQAKHSPPTKPAPPSPHKCVAHNESYDVSGTLDSGSLAAGTKKGTFSGTLAVFVTKANDHAKTDKGLHKSYTLSSARVDLHHANPAALPVGSRLHLEGTVTALPLQCSHTGFTPTVTIAKAEIESPKAHH